jgi:hypothetical protein
MVVMMLQVSVTTFQRFNGGHIMSKYNATVYEYDADGQQLSTGVCHAIERNGRLQMFAATGVQCTGYEGKAFQKDEPDLGVKAGDAVYDYYYRQTQIGPDRLIVRIEIVLDNCKGYKNRIKELALPPAYKRI